jgi:hypothetical protein
MAFKDLQIPITEFQALRFNVMAMPPRQSFTSIWPNLAKYDEFKNSGRNKFDRVSPTSVFKYLVLMYDPASPITTRVENYVERKSICAEVAGFETNEAGEFIDEAQDVIRLVHPRAELMFHRFLQLFHNMEYTYACTLFRDIHEHWLNHDLDKAKKAMAEWREAQSRLLARDRSAEQALYRIVLSRSDVITQLRPEFYRNHHRNRNATD